MTADADWPSGVRTYVHTIPTRPSTPSNCCCRATTSRTLTRSIRSPGRGREWGEGVHHAHNGHTRQGHATLASCTQHTRWAFIDFRANAHRFRRFGLIRRTDDRNIITCITTTTIIIIVTIIHDKQKSSARVSRYNPCTCNCLFLYRHANP